VTSRREILALLERHGLHTNKALGQNFLVDDRVLADIARAALRDGPTALVEIGPGPGTLTALLAESGLPLVALEKDRGLVPVLSDLFRDRPNVRILEADALETDFTALHPGHARPAVIGNVPYYISSPLLIALIAQHARLGPTTLMLQREVVDRLVAAPGSKDYGSLSVMLQARAELERVRHVPPSAFVPRPKVDSTVLRIRWLPEPRVPLGDPEHFERVVRAAFGQRRKMLRNSLRTRFEDAALSAAEAASKVSLARRAETLNLDEFSRLALALSTAGAHAPGPSEQPGEEEAPATPPERGAASDDD
jgi:16S rRNA (adenine1518-N6/adenine1519-N6)-dimethyltransferase